MTVGQRSATFKIAREGNKTTVSDGKRTATFKIDVDLDDLESAEKTVYKKGMKSDEALAKAILFVSMKNKAENPMGCFKTSKVSPICDLCPIRIWCKGA